MTKKELKGVLINVGNGTAKVHTITLDDENGGYLDEIHSALDCECFTIAERKFSGEYLDIYLDDMGLYKPYTKPSVAVFDGDELVETIYGNVFICSANSVGESVSLNERQIIAVLQSLGLIDWDGEYRLAARAEL